MLNRLELINIKNLPEFLTIKFGKIFCATQKLIVSSPIDLDINCSPNAKEFLNAVKLCKNTTSFSKIENSLLIKSGRFSAKIKCLDGEGQTFVPKGKVYNIDGENFVKSLKAISKFVANNENQLWSSGVLISKGSAFATNNIILIEKWLNEEFPITCNIPLSVIEELVRLKEYPESIQSDEKTLTFHYKDDRFITTVLYDLQWPNVRKILNVESDLKCLPNDFFNTLEELKSFVDKDGFIYFDNNRISTEYNGSTGATFEVQDLEFKKSKFKFDSVEKLKGVVEKIDISKYPKPCPFVGDKLRGVIIGVPM